LDGPASGEKGSKGRNLARGSVVLVRQPQVLGVDLCRVCSLVIRMWCLRLRVPISFLGFAFRIRIYRHLIPGSFALACFGFRDLSFGFRVLSLLPSGERATEKAFTTFTRKPESGPGCLMHAEFAGHQTGVCVCVWAGVEDSGFRVSGFELRVAGSR
jgi:hypothetical protein